MEKEDSVGDRRVEHVEAAGEGGGASMSVKSSERSRVHASPFEGGMMFVRASSMRRPRL